MKALFGFFLLLGLSGAASAQSSKMKDCIMMKDGKMMVTKGGMSMDMMSDSTFKNGTMVMKDGTVKMKDGSTHMLKDGECVIGGKVKMMKGDKMSGDKMR
jgi:Domain of unknown function (DUF6799)